MNTFGINNQSQTAKLYEKLAAGKRINRAADDPAGLAKAQKEEAQIRQQEALERNYAMSQAKSLIADSAYSGMADYSADITANEVMAANDLYTDSDLAAINLETESYTEGIRDLESDTLYNTMQAIPTGTVDVSSAESRQSSINTARSINGAYYNMLSHSRTLSSVMSLNTTASKSRTEDTEMGETVSKLKKETALERYREELQRKRQADEARRSGMLFQ